MIRTQLELYFKTPNDIQKEYLESVIKSFYGYKRFWISVMGKRFRTSG
jgi:hypothetical protein